MLELVLSNFISKHLFRAVQKRIWLAMLFLYPLWFSRYNNSLLQLANTFEHFHICHP
jgi:hypothetical protein